MSDDATRRYVGTVFFGIEDAAGQPVSECGGVLEIRTRPGGWLARLTRSGRTVAALGSDEAGDLPPAVAAFVRAILAPYNEG